ncbi:MAG: nickel-type superoxide dismutase maturation protease [Candidatus Saccharibacteria bacterium]|nr:nickel-type superoxide dismutase maturation protease [Candidatus Saccharibacteria bacterium]
MFLIRHIVGVSMLPALKPDSVVVATRVYRTLKAGDVVILDHEGIEKVKRITRVAIDKIFLEGDNSAYSTDSRHFGWLESRTVRGKVIWPRTQHIKQKSRR